MFHIRPRFYRHSLTSSLIHSLTIPNTYIIWWQLKNRSNCKLLKCMRQLKSRDVLLLWNHLISHYGVQVYNFKVVLHIYIYFLYIYFISKMFPKRKLELARMYNRKWTNERQTRCSRSSSGWWTKSSNRILLQNERTQNLFFPLFGLSFLLSRMVTWTHSCFSWFFCRMSEEGC